MINRILINIIMCIVVTSAYAYSDSKITIKVIDENGKYIEGARVGVGFTQYLFWDSKEIPVVGFSNESGSFTASANADNDLGFNVTKDGFYQSTGQYKFKQIQIVQRW